VKRKDNIFDISINIICLIQLVGIVLYLIVIWNSLPDQIPGHYGLDGSVTRYDGKGIILIEPVFAGIMYVVMLLAERSPLSWWNTGVTVMEENKFRVYRILKDLMAVTKLLIVAGFICITIMQSLSQIRLGLFLFVWFFLLFGSIIYYIIRLIKAK